MSLLVVDGPCHLMLLLSLRACTQVSRGGLRPPLFIMRLLVGHYSWHPMLLLSLYACTVVLRAGLLTLKRLDKGKLSRTLELDVAI